MKENAEKKDVCTVVVICNAAGKHTLIYDTGRD